MRPESSSALREYVYSLREDDALGLAAELAYRFLFALFPFGIFVAALLAYGSQWLGVESAPQQIVQGLGDNLPPDLAAAVQPELERVISESRPGLLSIGALGALWSATGATLALVKAMNRAYDVDDERSFLRRYATALVLTLLATGGIVVSFVSIVGGTVITDELAQRLGWGGTTWAIANIVRWPAAFLLLTVAVGVLLRLAPNVAAPWRLTLGGGALFAVAWLAATYAFGWYVANVANYGSTYGALAGVIVIMIWFYLSALILVLVAHLVAMATSRVAPERIEDSRHAPAVLENAEQAAVRAVRSLTGGDEQGDRARGAAREKPVHPQPDVEPDEPAPPAPGRSSSSAWPRSPQPTVGTDRACRRGRGGGGRARRDDARARPPSEQRLAERQACGPGGRWRNIRPGKRSREEPSRCSNTRSRCSAPGSSATSTR